MQKVRPIHRTFQPLAYQTRIILQKTLRIIDLDLSYFQYKMEPTSTVTNSAAWRIWHATNYTIGAITFLFGSLLLFPYFATILTLQLSSSISAYLYTFGSFTFALADFTEWTHYESRICGNRNSSWCLHKGYSVNFFTNFIGSSIYLVGSAMFLPQINMTNEGLICFIVASAIIVGAQTWKIVRGVRQGMRRNDVWKTLAEDLTGVLVDLFAGLGASMYFTGSFVFFNPNPIPQVIAAAIFSLGGFLFYLSGAFMLKRYFLNSKENNGSIQIASTETKMEQISQSS